MNSESVLSLLDYVCNEARNAVHASFGLMDFRPDETSPAAWQTWVSASRSSADRLLRTIDDMRELLAGPPAAGFGEQIDLVLCVGEIAELLNLVGRKEAARLVVEGGTASVWMWYDRPALEQTLTRILRLALQWSLTGAVRASVSPDADDWVRLEIVTPEPDTLAQMASWLNGGLDQIGPDAEDLGSLVSLLVTGRRLRAMGGTVELVPSTGLPECLAIRLPARTEGHVSAASRWSADGQLQALVVEDSDDSYALTQLLLKNERVERARNGMEAIDKVKQRRFDLVFMDVHMPGMDGYATIRAIRDWETESGNARTPIVILSSDDIGTQTRSAAQCGCSGYLRKPVRQADLMELLTPLRASRESAV